MNFAAALLSVHLDVLDMTDGAAGPDQIDVVRCEDGSALLVGHVGDDGAACSFDLDGKTIEHYRALLNRPATKIFLQNGRILSPDELQERLLGNVGSESAH